MTPAQLSRTVLGAVGRAVADGELAVPLPGPEAVTVERTRGPDRGDYGTGIALKLARPAGKPPRQVARIIARRLEGSDGIVRVDVAGPGFLNIHLAATAHADLVRTVRALGTRYGHGDSLATAPPVPVTGPRSAACDRLLRACGAPTAPSATNAPTAPSTVNAPATAPAKSPAPLPPSAPTPPPGPSSGRRPATRPTSAPPRTSSSAPRTRCSGSGTPTPGPGPCCATPATSGSGRRRARTTTPFPRRPHCWA